MIDSNSSFGTWLLEWYKVYKKPKLTRAGQIPIETALRLHIPISLSDTPLASLKVFQIDQALAEIPPSRTKKLVYDIILSALNKAYRIELISKDFSKMLEPVKYNVKNGTALSVNEMNLFFKKIEGHKLENLMYFYILTGCRRHEALTLLWSDIDFKNKNVLLRGTKTRGSFRNIPLTVELTVLLSRVSKQAERVFPFNDVYVTEMFHKFCPTHKLHDLRHTFATICAQSNIHPTATQRMLGHSQITTTMRIYTHVSNSFVSSEAEKFNFHILDRKND